MTPNRPRLLLADDEPAIIELLKILLADDYDIAGVATDGVQLVDAAQRLEPDLIVTDISMGDTSGFVAARSIRAARPASKILILSGFADVNYLRETMRAGLNGYVLKPHAAEELLPAVRTILDGGTYISPEIRDH